MHIAAIAPDDLDGKLDQLAIVLTVITLELPVLVDQDCAILPPNRVAGFGPFGNN